jgi:hypothetical protein
LPDEDKSRGPKPAPVARLHRFGAGCNALAMQVFAEE